ncbi:nuclear transport factor 2 family protein [Sphingomicrobium nitratireducens]|uniref:nuclear transport factor 2 family protein n=1 Tax=Sphingomicrobium nitratireducens TaxID=2964666 RepID=UPI00223FB843|nr:nuclear transport factor 2 family protein [Sphingomicrobium nitratireducens]
MRAILFAIAILFALAPTGALAQQSDFDVATETSMRIGQSYFEAYIERDWDRLEPMLADDVVFQDTTAKYLFGGQPQEGKATLAAFFRTAYAGISRMEFTPSRSFASSDTAVFEGMLDWDVDMGGGRIVSTSMPFVVILALRDGKIVSHRDFADYRPFLDANAASLAKVGSTKAAD